MNFKQGGRAIQRLRKEYNMPQEQLAKLADIASNSISRIERGLLMPALPPLIGICSALGAGVNSILAALILRIRDGIKVKRIPAP